MANVGLTVSSSAVTRCAWTPPRKAAKRSLDSPAPGLRYCRLGTRMGGDPAYHRLGIGRALIEAAVEAVRTRGVRYQFVATLHPAIPYEPYERTRRFYEAMGFAFVLEEQFPTDPANPLGYYLKQL